MQFTPSADGYAIKELYRLESAKKYIKMDGDVGYSWNNKGLKGVDKPTLDKYFALVGQEFWGHYKKTIKSWEKFAQDKINSVEKKIMAAEAAVEKKFKKLVPTAKQLEEAKKKIESAQQAWLTTAQNEIQKKYQELLPSLSKKAHDAVIKKLGNAAGALKKKHGAFAWATVKFIVIVAVVVLAAIALGPVGAAVATAAGIAALTALVIKGISTGVTAIKDVADYLKQWNKVSDKANADIDEAVAAIDKAYKTMEAAESVYQSLKLKIATAQGEIIEMEKKLGSEKNNKKIAEAQKKIQTARSELEKISAGIGSQPAEVLTQLKTARMAIKKADDATPKKVKDTTSKVLDALEQVADLADKAVSAV